MSEQTENQEQTSSETSSEENQSQEQNSQTQSQQSDQNSQSQEEDTNSQASQEEEQSSSAIQDGIKEDEDSEEESSSEDNNSSDDDDSNEEDSEESDSDSEEDAGEDYELEVDENSLISQEQLDQIAEFASENNLSKEEAEEVIGRTESLLKQGASQAQAQMKQQIIKRREELFADPDFSSKEKATESFAMVKKAVDLFGDENLTKALNDPNIGNSLPLAKFLKKIGEKVSDDMLPPKGEGKKGDGKSDNSYSEAMKRMYPEHFEEKK